MTPTLTHENARALMAYDGATLNAMESRLSRLGAAMPADDVAAWQCWMEGKRAEYAQFRSGLEGRSSGLGFLPWLIAGGVAVVGSAAAWLWRSHEETQKTSRYLECVENAVKAGKTYDEAVKACGGSVLPTWALVALIAGGVTLAGVLLLFILKR